MYKVVFAATIKDTPIDDLVDIVDDASDGDFGMVAWKRGDVTRIILWASIKIRGILQSEFSDFKIRPVGQLVETMSDPRNKWIEPSGNKSYEAADEAVSSWMREITSQFDAEDAVGTLDVEPEDDEVPMEETNVQIEKVGVKNKVLELFGLTGDETDENGENLGFFTFNVKEKGKKDEQ